QIVDILGNDFDGEMFFQPGDGPMAGIGSFFQYFPAAGIVKVNDRIPIMDQSLRCTNVFDPVIGPQTIRIPERSDTAVRTHTGTGKYHYFLFHSKFVQKANIVKAERRSEGKSIFR